MFPPGPRDVNEVFMMFRDGLDFYPLFARAVKVIAKHTKSPTDINRLIDRIETMEKPVAPEAHVYYTWLNDQLDEIEAELIAQQRPTRAEVADVKRQRALAELAEREANMDDPELDVPPPDMDTTAAADATVTELTSSLHVTRNRRPVTFFDLATPPPAPDSRTPVAPASATVASVTASHTPVAPTTVASVTASLTPVASATVASVTASHTPVAPAPVTVAPVAAPVAATASHKRTAAAAVLDEASNASPQRKRRVHESDDEGDEGEAPTIVTVRAPVIAPVRAPVTAAEVAAREDQLYVARATSPAHVEVFEDILYLHGLYRQSQHSNHKYAPRNEPLEELDDALPKAGPTDAKTFEEYFTQFPSTHCKREVLNQIKIPALYVSLYQQNTRPKRWRYYFAHSARSKSSPAMCMQLEVNPDHMACMVWGGVDQLNRSSQAHRRYRVLQLAQIIDFLVLARPYSSEKGRGRLTGFDGIGRLQFSQSDTQLEPFLRRVVNAQVEIAVFDEAADGWCIKVSMANARRLYERYRVMGTEGKNQNI